MPAKNAITAAARPSTQSRTAKVHSIGRLSPTRRELVIHSIAVNNVSRMRIIEVQRRVVLFARMVHSAYRATRTDQVLATSRSLYRDTNSILPLCTIIQMSTFTWIIS